MIVHNGIISSRHIPTVSDVKTCQAWVFISASNIPRDIDRVSIVHYLEMEIKDGRPMWICLGARQQCLLGNVAGVNKENWAMTFKRHKTLVRRMDLALKWLTSRYDECILKHTKKLH